jgi:uncharacterized SAM-binding protein YcdF (DUF218 family)
MTFWILFLYFVLAEAFVYIIAFNKGPQDKKIDVIMVLGANDGFENHRSKDRALNANLAKLKYSDARFLLTGNESKKEITTYKELLSENSYFEFIIESKSTTTWENFKFSKTLLKDLSIDKSRILIVTSQYHQNRSLAMARCLGLDSYIFGKDTRTYTKAPLFFLKERFSVAKYFPQMLFSYLRYS